MNFTRRILFCMALTALTGVNAFSTNPTSGALLTITGTVSDGTNTMSISLTVSDKDVHSGNPQTVPIGGTCTAADQISTDAYVMQAGAPTGCDPTNAFEGGLSQGNFTFSSPEGSLVSYDLGVTTLYWVNESSKCNTSDTICSNNSSFMTVMNNSSSSSFTGTITLAASSPNCPVVIDGLVSDSFTGTLPADEDANVVLALANDASGCGGFSSSITQTLSPGVQTIYSFDNGDNKAKITPSPYSTGGESLTVTEVPILKSAFVPPSNYPNETCPQVADYTAINGADTCIVYQFDCSFGGVPGGGDCNTLLYTLLVSYDLAPDLAAESSPDFLVVHGTGCPTSATAVAQSIFTDYFATRQDPTTKGAGSGTGSCFEVTYTPGGTAITNGTVSRFVGWQSPVDDTQLNQVKAGSTRPLQFTWNDNSGNPVTNLNYCANQSGTGCSAPWINLSTVGIVCPSGAPINPSTDDSTIDTTGGSGFNNDGNGNYHVNWKIPKSWKGFCVNVQVTLDSGVAEFPAALGFQFN